VSRPNVDARNLIPRERVALCHLGAVGYGPFRATYGRGPELYARSGLSKGIFSLKLYTVYVVTYRFTFKDEAVARSFVHELTRSCSRLCIYRTGRDVTVLDGSDVGQREEIYSAAWVHGAKTA